MCGDRFHKVLRMNGPMARNRTPLERFFGVPGPRQGFIQERAIRAFLHSRQERLQSRRYVAHGGDVDRMPSAEMCPIDVDLNDGRALGIELAPGKVAAQE